MQTLYFAYTPDATEKQDELRSNHLRNPIKRGRGADVTPHTSKEDAHKRAHGKGGGVAPKGKGQGEEGLLSSYASLYFASLNLICLQCIHR